MDPEEFLDNYEGVDLPVEGSDVPPTERDDGEERRQADRHGTDA